MLKCYVEGRNLVNGTPKQFKIAEGAVFTDNYNETLDSGTIILPQLTEEIEIEPYDILVIFSTNDSKVKINQRRMCVDTYTCTQTSLDPAIYRYEITLISETKLLEGILLPSIAITKSDRNRTVGDYLVQYLNEYGPKTNSNNEGAYGNKYAYGHNAFDDPTYQDTVWARFGSKVCPEMQWNEPTLREVITDLMMTEDCIPVVQNNVINFIDISSVRNYITDEQRKGINYIQKSQSSQDYVSEIKTTLKNAMSDGEIIKICEDVGFRNNEAYLLTTENVKIETMLPIWKLKKCYMKYYISAYVLYTVRVDGEDYTRGTDIGVTVTRPLYEEGESYSIILEYGFWQTRPIFYGSWGSIHSADANYQNTSLYYKRGQKGIFNFNAKQSRQFLWIENQTSVLDLLINKADMFNVNAIYGEVERQAHEQGINVVSIQIENFYGGDWKGCAFHLEYEALGEHTIFASKGVIPRNKRQVVDNQTQSYVNITRQCNLEYQKANRLGNQIKMVNARYKTNETNIPRLGDCLSPTYMHDIIFKKEIAVFDNFIKANYQATDYYVLKDYYTGIKSKLRSWKILDGNEAFVRADVLKFYVNATIPSKDNGNTSKYPSYAGLGLYMEKFNHCLIRFKTLGNTYLPSSGYYYVEFQKALCGYSFIATIRMFDNAIIGKYVADSNYDLGHGEKAMAQQNCSYVDGRGENIGGNILFFENQVSPIDKNSYPKTDASNFSGLVANIPFSFQKDNKEITQITIQFEGNASANDMFLGKK